jgi:SAM-dependent methyltransferase
MSTSVATAEPGRIECATAPCVICSGPGSTAFTIGNYAIQQCSKCGHQFIALDAAAGHVERTYADDYFTGGGAGYSDYLSEERLLIARGRWYARRMSRFARPGEVLDVGAAAGFALRGFEEEGWQCHGVEPNPAMAQYASDRFGFPVAGAAFETWETERAFDLVTMLQVLPHFVDPRAALGRAAALLRPGGHLLIETWNRSSWTARLFGKNWHEYSPPSVLHWFSIAGLTRLARETGLTPRAQGRPSKWIDVGHAKSLLRTKARESLVYRAALGIAQIIPDRVALPYPSEDLFWILLQRD